MNASRFTAALMFLAVGSAQAQVVPPEKRAPRLIVGTLIAEPELRSLAESLSDAMVIELQKRNDMTVISQGELELISAHVLDEKNLSAEDCRRAHECYARLAAAADADRTLEGRLIKLENMYVVTWALTNVNQFVVERRDSCSAESEAALTEQLLETVRRAFGEPGAPQPKLEVTGKDRALVMPFSGLPDRPDLMGSMSQIFGLLLRKHFTVVTRDEVENMVEYTIMKSNCLGGDDDLMECLTDVGRALGVQFLAVGFLGQFSDEYVLVLKLLKIDVLDYPIHRVSESSRCQEASLPRALKFATEKLLGVTSTGTGELAVVTDEEGTLSLDGEKAIALPLDTPLSALSIGRHELSINVEDFFPFHTTVYVDSSPDPFRITPQLIPLPEAWYQKWWVWTMIGAVAAVGAATTYYIVDNDQADVGINSGRDR